MLRTTTIRNIKITVTTMIIIIITHSMRAVTPRAIPRTTRTTTRTFRATKEHQDYYEHYEYRYHEHPGLLGIQLG